MRNLGIALIAAAALCLAVPAIADDDDRNPCGNHGNNCDDGGGDPGGNGGPAGGVFTNTIDNAIDTTIDNSSASTSDAFSASGAFSGVDFSGVDFGSSNSNTDTDQANDQRTTIDASDRSVTKIEAADIPVASAAPVFASACSAGVSGQSMGFGGSLATTNPMCDMALAAEMARAVGNDELAYELTMEAATFARARTNIVRRFGQWIPFVGSLW